MGDFNSRTGLKADFIENDSTDLNNFDDNDLLSEDYEIDYCSHRNSWDHTNKVKTFLVCVCPPG
jgi:hypothetical protein